MSDAPEETQLSEHLEQLAKELTQYTSYRAVFLRGIVYGVGTAIGASIIAAILVSAGYYFSRPLDTVENLPALSRDAVEALFVPTSDN